VIVASSSTNGANEASFGLQTPSSNGFVVSNLRLYRFFNLTTVFGVAPWVSDYVTTFF
jgi:hypothetical protein